MGIPILTQGFDGQMYRMAVYNRKDQSLTLFQEHNEVWTEVGKYSKQNIADIICDILSQTQELNIDENIPQLFANFPNISEDVKMKQLKMHLLWYVMTAVWQMDGWWWQPNLGGKLFTLTCKDYHSSVTQV